MRFTCSSSPSRRPRRRRPRAQSPAPPSPERELVSQYCVRCHNQRMKSGGVSLDAADPINAAGDTRLVVDGRIHDRGAVGVVLGGDLAVHTLVSPGCRPIGRPMTVTKAAGTTTVESSSVPSMSVTTMRGADVNPVLACAAIGAAGRITPSLSQLVPTAEPARRAPATVRATGWTPGRRRTTG